MSNSDYTKLEAIVKTKILVFIFTMPFFLVMLFLAVVMILSGCAPGAPEMVQGTPAENAFGMSGFQPFWDYPCPAPSTLVIHGQTEPTLSKKYIENLCEYYTP